MKHREQRRWLAEQAARCMSEYAIDDPAAALRRVLGRQGATPDRRQWPEPAEILAALRDYQRLFRGQTQETHLVRRREAALQAMAFFARFQPRLVGPVLEGTADAHSPIHLHLHTDDTDAVPRFLDEAGIPAQPRSRRVRLDPVRDGDVLSWAFSADGLAFDLLVLPQDALHHAPLGSDRKPMKRASEAQLRVLLADERLSGHASE